MPCGGMTGGQSPVTHEEMPAGATEKYGGGGVMDVATPPTGKAPSVFRFLIRMEGWEEAAEFPDARGCAAARRYGSDEGGVCLLIVIVIELPGPGELMAV